MGPVYQRMGGKIILGILRYALMAYTGTGEGASVTKTIPWDVIFHLGRLSVRIVFGCVIGLAVNIIFRHISAALIISMVALGFYFVTVIVIPPVAKISISRVSINSLMIPV